MKFNYKISIYDFFRLLFKLRFSCKKIDIRRKKMELHNQVTRLISAKASKISNYTGRELKEAIFKSEGRVLMGKRI